MKKIFIAGIIALMGSLLFSCAKEEESVIVNPDGTRSLTATATIEGQATKTYYTDNGDVSVGSDAIDVSWNTNDSFDAYYSGSSHVTFSTTDGGDKFTASAPAATTAGTATTATTPTGALGDDIIRQVMTDSRGEVWVVTNRGVQRYHRPTDGFQTVTFHGEPGANVNDAMQAVPLYSVSDDRQCNNMYLDRRGRLWVAFRDRGLRMTARGRGPGHGPQRHTPQGLCLFPVLRVYPPRRRARGRFGRGREVQLDAGAAFSGVSATLTSRKLSSVSLSLEAEGDSALKFTLPGESVATVVMTGAGMARDVQSVPSAWKNCSTR